MRNQSPAISLPYGFLNPFEFVLLGLPSGEGNVLRIHRRVVYRVNEC